VIETSIETKKYLTFWQYAPNENCPSAEIPVLAITCAKYGIGTTRPCYKYHVLTNVNPSGYIY